MPGADSGVRRPRRVLVVANPAAGLRPGGSAGERAAREVERAGAQVALHRTGGPGDATRAAAKAAADGYDLVIAAGGDGTVHEVANGLAGSGLPLAVAPSGTMNLLARVLGVRLDPAVAAAAVMSGFRVRPVEPGEANGRLFLLMAGAGFDAWVLRELLRGPSAKIGFGDYVRGAVAGLTTFPFPTLAIEHDGHRAEGHTVIVGRAPLYGGFLRPTPNVRLEDDTLELCALDGGASRLAARLPRLWSGAHGGCSGVTLVRTARATITSPSIEMPYQLDGELVGTLPVTIQLSRRRVALAVPASR